MDESRDSARSASISQDDNSNREIQSPKSSRKASLLGQDMSSNYKE